MEKVLKAIISKSIKHYELYREVYSKGWTVEQIMNASLDEVNKIKDVESQFKHASFKHLEVIQKNLDKSSFRHSHGKVFLEKTDQENNQIIIISIPSPSSRIPQSDQLTCDIQGQVDFALKKILHDKCDKMGRLKNYDKRILLIENQYMFTTRENINKSLRKFVSLIKGIDEIWVMSLSEIYRLY